jgi:glucose/arabinose dehydrogenase
MNNSKKTIEISPLSSRLHFVGGIGDPSDPQNPTACVMSGAVANYRLSQGEPIGDATDELDCWWPSDEARKKWALGLIARLPGTRGDMATTLRRGFRCADMAVRVLAPITLRAASREDLAAQLEAVSPIVDVESAKAARGVTQRASKSVAAFVAASNAASAASVAFAFAIAAEVYASYTKAAKTKTCPRIESEFRCPSCGGGHFGRDVTTSPDGRMVVSDDAHCHDEHKKGCDWVGDYAANLHPARTKST